MNRWAIFLAALLLAGFAILAVRSHRSVWVHEPETILGIKFGVPLSQSVPKCTSVILKECYENTLSGPILRNTPDEFGVVGVVLSGEDVANLFISYPSFESDIVKRQMIEEYGEPQDGDERSKSMTWYGKRINLYINTPASEDDGYIDASLREENKTTVPIENPFKK